MFHHHSSEIEELMKQAFAFLSYHVMNSRHNAKPVITQ